MHTLEIGLLSGGSAFGGRVPIHFETDPEFQGDLDWMGTFVREPVDPLDDAFRDAGAP